MSDSEFLPLLDYLLDILIDVRSGCSVPISCKFSEAGQHIANLYRHSSTHTLFDFEAKSESWWVSCGTPLLFLFVAATEQVGIPEPNRKVNLREIRDPHLRTSLDDKVEIVHLWHQRADRSLPVWILRNKDHGWWRDGVQSLRRYLIRLHAEHECLKSVLRAITQGRISIEPRSRASDSLQLYLNKATKRIARLESGRRAFSTLEVAELARQVEDAFNPGLRDSILERLDTLQIRRSVFQKVDAYSQRWRRSQISDGEGARVAEPAAAADRCGEATPRFDVFLSHNSNDRATVRQVGEALKARGLSVWLDEWELVPGRPWLEALEKIVQSTNAAAVLVGSDGIGPWQDREMRGCLTEFVDRALTVIPVLLPGAPAKPDLPMFLKQFTWVDLRRGLTKKGLDRLYWGITGVRPGR
jgi:hypothetical protein